MGMLSRGIAALIRRQKQANSADLGTITYTRLSGGGATDLTGLAWVGNTVFASNLEGGARIEFGELDLLIPVADLAFEPALGDRVALAGGLFTGTFECCTPTTGEPGERYSDQTRQLWRVHCKRVG